MKEYELLLIIAANFSDKDIPAVAEKIAQIITETDAKIVLEDNLGRKKLAFPIKKNEAGTYLLFQFTGEGQIIKQLNKALDLTNEVIRYLVVVNPPVKIKEPRKITDRWPSGKKEKIKKEMVKTEAARKISLEDLDEKLDNILEDDILK